MILDFIYAVLTIFLVISLIFIILILTQKYRHKLYLTKVNQARDYLFKKYIDKEEVEKTCLRQVFS